MQFTANYSNLLLNFLYATQEKENGSKMHTFFTFLGYFIITGIQCLVIRNILHLNKGQRNDAKNFAYNIWCGTNFSALTNNKPIMHILSYRNEK